MAEEKNNIIEFEEIKKTKVAVEINDQNMFLISIPTKFIKFLGRKIDSFFGGKK